MRQFPFRAVVAALIGLVLATSRVRAAETRTWTDSSGKFSVEAALISADDQVVLLKSKDGKTLRIPRAKLSQADRDFLQSPSQPAAANPFEEVTDGPVVLPIAALKKK
jgi:hypothetical protein